MKLRHLATLALAATLTIGLAACSSDDPEPQNKPETPTTPDDPDPTPDPGTGTTDIYTVADKEGMNIKGVVACAGKPIPGVAVSDGYSVAVTDANGHYWLNSEKQYKYVFVSIPSGYKVANDGIFPQFYSAVASATDKVEQVNFELTAIELRDHVVLALADMHLAKENKDLTQYENRFIPDVNATIATYQAQGKDVYCITLGDETWDLYWYSNSFSLPHAKPYLSKIKATLFNCMGNHDNDPYCADDFSAENAWRTNMGPSYYSFNVGDVHYVVLDNIAYTNEGGSQGTLGNREYTTNIPDRQLNWLRADLAAVADKTKPLVVCTHAPLYEKPKIYDTGVPVRPKMDDLDKLLAALAPFSNVKVLTGHAHTNYVVDNGQGNLVEYNVGAVCATWWRTGFQSDNHICRDGSVGGYRVLEVSGSDIRTYYKSLGYDRNYQFRSYDLNECQITAAKYCPNSTDATIADLGDCVKEYLAKRTDNYVMLNVFAYDDNWKVKVTEDGKPLTVTRVNGYDPLHIISYACARFNKGAGCSDGNKPSLTAHLFQAQASSPSSTLVIEVTDAYGNIYTETMARPKAMTTTMQ